jgi:hypothetical protein
VSLGPGHHIDFIAFDFAAQLDRLFFTPTPSRLGGSTAAASFPETISLGI